MKTDVDGLPLEIIDDDDNDDDVRTDITCNSELKLKNQKETRKRMKILIC